MQHLCHNIALGCIYAAIYLLISHVKQDKSEIRIFYVVIQWRPVRDSGFDPAVSVFKINKTIISELFTATQCNQQNETIPPTSKPVRMVRLADDDRS
jgi:hypothetical protein